MGGTVNNNYAPVKVSYKEGGKQKTETLYMQKGMIVSFSGDTSNEKGKYTVQADGSVTDSKGKKVGTINATSEQVAALEGMSRLADEGVNTGKKHSFVVSDADINAAMTEEGGNDSSLKVNMALNRHGQDARTHYRDGQWDTGANMMNGTYKTDMTNPDGSRASEVSIATPKTLKEAKKQQEAAWREEHPILNAAKKAWNWLTK